MTTGDTCTDQPLPSERLRTSLLMSADPERDRIHMDVGMAKLLLEENAALRHSARAVRTTGEALVKRADIAMAGAEMRAMRAERVVIGWQGIVYALFMAIAVLSLARAALALLGGLP